VKKIKLGIIFDQQINSGGGFQQSLNAAIIAKKLPADKVDVNFYTTIKKNIKVLREYNIQVKLINISIFSKIRIYFYRKIKNRYLFNFFRFFEKNNPREKLILFIFFLQQVGRLIWKKLIISQLFGTYVIKMN